MLPLILIVSCTSSMRWVVRLNSYIADRNAFWSTLSYAALKSMNNWCVPILYSLDFPTIFAFVDLWFIFFFDIIYFLIEFFAPRHSVCFFKFLYLGFQEGFFRLSAILLFTVVYISLWHFTSYVFVVKARLSTLAWRFIELFVTVEFWQGGVLELPFCRKTILSLSSALTFLATKVSNLVYTEGCSGYLVLAN